MNRPIYRSLAGEAALNALYDRQLARLGLPTESRRVPTRFGETHVLVAGPADGPPLVTVHGVYANAPYNLSLFRPLAERFRMYALDTVGHSVRSAHRYIPAHDDSYGLWAADALDGLGLRQAPFISSSFGAGIVLRLAAIAPQRITRALFLVPSGIANGPILRMMTDLLLPWVAYLAAPSRSRLLKACAPMMSEEDESFLELVAGILSHVRIRPEGPRLATAEELRGFTAPVRLYAADDDIFFPASRVLPRAHVLFSNLVGAEAFSGRHLPSRTIVRRVNEDALGFFAPE